MGLNTQTAEPRVQVTAHIVAPCEELPGGFYALKIAATEQPDTGYKDMIVDAAKIPNLIHDLQNVMIEVAAQSELHKAMPAATAEEDAKLLADLEVEETVTITGAAFSSPLTAAIEASGNYRAIWDALDSADSEAWNVLSNYDLIGIIRDYGHTLPTEQERHLAGLTACLTAADSNRPTLLQAAQTIFVGRYARIKAASPAVDAAFVAESAARDATPDITVQLGGVERAIDALASRAAEEGFFLVMGHDHELPPVRGEIPAWHPEVRWRPYLERRIYAPATTAPDLKAI